MTADKARWHNEVKVPGVAASLRTSPPHDCLAVTGGERGSASKGGRETAARPPQTLNPLSLSAAIKARILLDPWTRATAPSVVYLYLCVCVFVFVFGLHWIFLDPWTRATAARSRSAAAVFAELRILVIGRDSFQRSNILEDSKLSAVLGIR